MVKRVVPKVVVLSNGRRFTTRYKRATRASLPANVTLDKTCIQRTARRSRRHQRGRGKVNLIKKVIKSLIVRKLTKEALKQAPKAYNKFTGKVKKLKTQNNTSMWYCQFTSWKSNNICKKYTYLIFYIDIKNLIMTNAEMWKCK